MRYLIKTNSSADTQTALNDGILGKPYVALVSGSTLDYNTLSPIEYNTIPLTFEVISGGTISWKTSYFLLTKTISYSLDSGINWTEITSTTEGVSFNVSAGDKVMFKGDNTAYGDSGNYNCFGGTAKFNAYGNIMSLIGGDNFSGLTSLSSAYTFLGLFEDCTVLISAKNLILPATTLTNLCYKEMFYGCTSLTAAPELPATALKSSCYKEMFRGCTSLTVAPELPATSVVNESCYEMFRGCTSLTTAPVLNFTKMSNQTCYQMFANCSSLNYIKCLSTDISAVQATDYWVAGVASTGTFVKNPSMNDWTTGVSGIPEGWTVIDAS